MGATDSTVYDVITRYRVEDHASGAFGRIDRSGRRLSSTFAGVRMSLRGAGRAAGELTASLGFRMTAGIVAGYGLYKTFSNLNAELMNTNQLAAQFNIAFQYSRDPVENFNTSLRESRSLVRGLIHDAARLPGQSYEFFQTARMISGPVFAAGGSAETVRKMAAQLAFVGPMSGVQNQEMAGRMTMEMLLGRARVQEPMFAYLSGTGLLPHAPEFNKLPQPRRLELVSRAFEKLADNPLLRETFIHTWDTQVGTLLDNLFGVQGILGKVAASPVDDALTALEGINSWLDRWKDTVGAFASLAAAPFAWAVGYHGIGSALTSRERNRLNPWMYPGTDRPAQNQRFAKWASEGLRGIALQDQANDLTTSWMKDMIAKGHRPEELTPFSPRIHDVFYQKLVEMEVAKLYPAEENRSASKHEIRQNISVTINTKQDVSPEALAVHIRRGLEREMQKPSIAERTLSPGMAGR